MVLPIWQIPIEGEPVPSPTPTPPPVSLTACTDADCVAKHGAGWHCENGYCVPSPNRKCSETNPCPSGYVCKSGYCVELECFTDAECVTKHGTGWHCENGVCKKTTPKCVPGAACTDSNIASTCPGGKCENGKCVCPATIAPCKEGKVCYTGGDCGDGICEGLDKPNKFGLRSGTCRCGTTGCPKGNIYNSMDGKCDPLYKFVRRHNTGKREDWAKEIEPVPGAVGTCECKTWITGGDGDGNGEQFKWSPELQALLARILDRANSLLDQPLGLSDEERQAIYNRIFEKIKGTEAPAIQSMLNRTSRQGLLGSPYAERGVAGIQRGTREALAGSERDIEIEEAQRRYEQLMGTTEMARSLFGTGMSAESLVEAANAARRGEGTSSLNSILQYLISLGGQNSAYYQALLNWLTTHQG